MEVYLIRHSTPQIENGICYGQSDIPISDKLFAFESEKIRSLIPENPDAVFSSPLKRCYKLAELFIPQHIITDKRLMEMDFGDWEMKKWGEINKQDLDRWMSDFVNVKVPNGENFQQLNKRVSHFIDELIRCDYKKILIITHSGVIRSFLLQILSIPPENAFKISIDYCSVTRINMAGDHCFHNVDFVNKRN